MSLLSEKEGPVGVSKMDILEEFDPPSFRQNASCADEQIHVPVRITGRGN